MKVLMVCLGNICRSPLAQGILEYNARAMGIEIEVDSAGTSSFHCGALPDPRSISTAFLKGIDITNQRARQFVVDDFNQFDIIFVMDKSNFREVLKLARNQQDIDKIRLLRNEDLPGSNQEVPDPYYGREDGFEEVFMMLDSATKVFLSKKLER
jgi:protein-tyrosine phosphatase